MKTVKTLIVLFSCALSTLAIGQAPYVVRDLNSVPNIYGEAQVLVDDSSLYAIEDVISGKYVFENLTTDNLQFTNKTYWIRFALTNPDSITKPVILQTARPVTNSVQLYEVERDRILSCQISGDDHPFSQKTIQHRQNLFKIILSPGTSHHFILRVSSDGEMLTVPLLLWSPQTRENRTSDENLMLGIYYGILLFVAIIYFFFYTVLKESTFLYYVLYVISLALLQFSLDGYFWQFIAPSNAWLANHMVLIAAACSVIFLLVYGRSFLKVGADQPRLNKLYNFFILVTTILLLLSLSNGVLYRSTFLTINVSSLLAMLLVAGNIVYLKLSGKSVSVFFSVGILTLIFGALVFILRNLSVVENNFFAEHSLKFFSAIEVILLSLSMANRYRELQIEKEEAQAELLIQLREKNRLMDSVNVRLEEQVEERTKKIKEQRETLEIRNKNILDSIRYAKIIQRSILPSQKAINELFPNSFVFYKPRDIVSGDFYWISKRETQAGETVMSIAAADCTGHGVPGAFVSIVGLNFLDLSATHPDLKTPAKVLEFLNKHVTQTFNREVKSETRKLRDGMDIALCQINARTLEMEFAGAKNPVYIVRKYQGEPPLKPHHGRLLADKEFAPYCLIELRGNKQPIGAYVGDDLLPFTNRIFQMQEGDVLYMLSDGYPDQFGGPKGRKFMHKTLKKLLLSIQEEPINKQKIILGQKLQEWMESGERKFSQIDDVLLIGIKVTALIK